MLKWGFSDITKSILQLHGKKHSRRGEKKYRGSSVQHVNKER